MVSPYYPNQVPWTDKKDWVSPENPGDLVEADHVNQLYAEVNAIGQDVGAHKSDYATHKAETTQAHGGNIDKVDGIDFRVNSGKLQYSTNGGGSWNDIMTSPIKSIQRGTLTLEDSTKGQNVTISSINVNKAFLILWHSTDSQYMSYAPWGEIVDSTTLLFERLRVNYKTQIKWQVIEYI